MAPRPAEMTLERRSSTRAGELLLRLLAPILDAEDLADVDYLLSEAEEESALEESWPTGSPARKAEVEAFAEVALRTELPRPEVVDLARQWANCYPDSLPDRLARSRMRELFGLPK
jgi:hypothetical protein